MSKTNCVNCGHGKDPDAIKCPFCGTTYFDMTGIDISGEHPVILMLKNPDGSVFQMKAFPTRFVFDMGPLCETTVDLSFDGYAPKVFQVHNEPMVKCDISFHN